MNQSSRTMKILMLHGCLTFVLLVHGQEHSGFISIDCGISEAYVDESTTIPYTSDKGYVDTGKIHNISSDYMSSNLSRQLWNLRSFPDGIKNCYTIHPAQAHKGDKYLIRATFKYGNYDSKNQPPEFELYLNGDKWHTIMFVASDKASAEVIYNVPAATYYIHVCLVNIRRGTPFISALELRPLDVSIYKTDSGLLNLFTRVDVGSTTSETVRYPADVYDRIWLQDTDTIEGFATSAWEAFSASYQSNTLSSNNYKPPYKVMATAVRPMNGSDSLSFWCTTHDSRMESYVYMHFAEIDGTLAGADKKREFDIYINDAPWNRDIVTDFLRPVTISSNYFVSDDMRLNFSIRPTSNSTLPPILNAIEIYELLELKSPPPTNQIEVDAIRNIKSEYRVQRNWQGDPCVPEEYSWEGLQCDYDLSTRIISLNISSSSLSGNMDISFSSLKSLVSLDLSYNNLTGQVPDFLSRLPFLKILNLSQNNFTGSLPPALVQKSKTGSLTLRTEGNQHLISAENLSNCQADSCARKKKFVVPMIASIASCLVIVVVILAIWWSLKRRKQQEDVVKSNTEDEIVEDKKRQFTYSELMTITNNFQRVLGKGAFGSVYAGHLADGTQVAVKMLSLPSTQGSKQFRTEALLLTKVHHRNLVSIIGYCNEGQHMGLIYEYMANGTIKEHLSGNNANVLSWEKRLRIACDAAQALEYLHDGCKPPIIHRDIKTVNILLTENMQAKISDFGISRLMFSNSGTYVSTEIAGTPGYMDPEYQLSNELNEKSDVYSFGIVVLELITGKPPVLRTNGNTHIVEWVRKMVERAEIKGIVDSRLNSDFNTNCAWKAVETAMACVELTSIQRPMMRQVVAELRECLEMEIARVKALKEETEEEHSSASSTSVHVSLGSSVGGPSAR